jgi:hypothetical protein
MMRPTIVALVLLAAPFTAAQAQETGGLALAPAMARGPVGLARPLPVVMSGITAQALQSASMPLPGSALGQQGLMDPQALSAQPSFGADGSSGDFGWAQHRPGRTKVVVNNFEGPVAIVSGNGNAVQQQTAQGSGPIALQQVSTVGGQKGVPSPGSGGGARNVVTGDGLIVQGAGGH